MNRLTETSFEKEMRIGFAKIDRIFDDAISKLDAMKAEYEKKLAPNASKMTNDIYAIFSSMQKKEQLQGLCMSEQNYARLQQMSIGFDRGADDMSIALRFGIGRLASVPIYRSPLIGLNNI